MDASPAITIKRHFGKIRDPRLSRRRRHLLPNIIVMAICAVIADCDTWEDIGVFVRTRRAWFEQFMALPHGVPSADTFARVFSRLDPAAFGACFQSWIQALAQTVGLSHIAIDGKSLRGSVASAGGLGPLHVVSAWATQQHLSLAQVVVDAKSNEITALPQLLALLELKGALVTIDAMGCQKQVAAQIVARQGDYVLTVKDNQPRLLADIQETLRQAFEGELPTALVDEYTTRERGHGRVEERSYVVVHSVEAIRDRSLWTKLTSVGMCRRDRTVNGQLSSEVHYFIGSRRMSARAYGEVTRNHWGIENHLHWQLDVTFAEDASRVLDRNAAQNFTWLRRMALSLLKRHPSPSSLRSKRKQAALDPSFLKEIACGSKKLGNG
jgi:predicted transposase YbfD/YdcC